MLLPALHCAPTTDALSKGYSRGRWGTKVEPEQTQKFGVRIRMICSNRSAHKSRLWEILGGGFFLVAIATEFPGLSHIESFDFFTD